MADADKEDSGFSVQDVIFNTGGATFTVLRHTAPGLEEKLDFRLLMMPNSNVYTFKGKHPYGGATLSAGAQAGQLQRIARQPAALRRIAGRLSRQGFHQCRPRRRGHG